MSDTPRTDEQELAYEAEDGSTYVHATFARKLERENAELRKDKERLDWLIGNSSISILRKDEDGEDWWVELSYSEAREDIDQAMEEAQ